MKKVAAFLFILGLFWGASGAQWAFAASKPPENEKLKVAVDLNSPPFSFIDDHDQQAGYLIDLVRAVSKNINAEVQILSANKHDIIQYLKTGKIDFAPFIAKSPEPPHWVVLGDTHTVDYDAIFVHRDEDAIISEDDLDNKRAIVLKDSLAHKYLLETAFKGEITVAHSISEALNILKSGAGQAFMGPQLATLAAIEMQGIKQIRMAPEPRFGPYTHRFAFAVRAGNDSLLNLLKAGLKKSIASGEYQNIAERWLHTLDPDQRRRHERQRNLVITTILAASTTLILAGLVFAFKGEVDRKTRSLVESEKRFRNLVDNLPGAVFRFRVTDRWELEFVSDAIERLTGYPVHEFTVSKKRTLGSVLYPDENWTIEKLRNHILESGRVETDIRVLHKSGETLWVHLRARTSIDEVDKGIVVDGILFDITEQKRVADLLMKQQSRMASSARLSALGEMAGGIAHEINNPLAIISLRTHQLAQLVKKGHLEAGDIFKITDSIEKTVDRISKIIKSLQIVARESKHDPFEIVSLRSIVNDTLELCLERMKKYGIKIIVDDNIDAIDLECRRVQISQVLLNLMNNAFDALMSLPTRYIRLSARIFNSNSNEYVEISVTDSGNGILKENAHKIFQPFFTTKGPGKGTGLGLSISKGMIESHDGFIWLDTDHPTTRFVIVLPRRQMGNSRETEAVSKAVGQPADDATFV